MSKRALLSVSDKTHIVPFAKGLLEMGYELVSTGGTWRVLHDAGLFVKAVEDVTGFPEILDGRVKTLHPSIHGALLADSENPDHQSQLKEWGIIPFDIVAANLYPFQETVAKSSVSPDEIMENIDIGGPAMLRAAAKNAGSVTVLVDPADYDTVLTEITAGVLTEERRRQLAAKVFRHTAHYDVLIADYFMKQTGEEFPEVYSVTYEREQSLRYGENPHQQAAFYKKPLPAAGSIASATQLHGKELSYNNIQDANAALEIVRGYARPTAVAVKHMNPCGIGTAGTIGDAFRKAHEADSTSIFGGIIALNREVDEVTAHELQALFLEIVMAPSFSEEALDILTGKQNIRLLEITAAATGNVERTLTSVRGGVLIQDSDEAITETENTRIATKRSPTDKEWQDLLFADKAVKHVKSNAIVLARDGQTVGIGAGQMNRVGAAGIAIEQAGGKAKGSVLASDAFFPMPDTVEAAAEAGVTAIIQPGGSKRDQEAIDACNRNGIAMLLTGVRHFKH